MTNICTKWNEFLRYFVDTSAWLALSDKRDQWHTLAETWWATTQPDDRFVCTLSIFSETVTLIRGRVSATEAIKWGEIVRQSKRVDILHEPREFHEEAWRLFKKYQDWKKLSYVDCLSFVAMEENLLHTVIAFDLHFKAYGFLVLPEQTK